MNQSGRKLSLVTLGILSVLLGAGPMIGAAAAHNVTSCTISPIGTINVPASGSTVIKVTVTYNSFSPGDWPMTVSADSVTPGYSFNSSAPFTGGVSGTHVFHLLVTNTNPTVTSGSADINAIWKTSSAEDCAIVTLLTFSGPPPPTVPEFPFGFALLMALAIPVMFIVKSKYAAKATR
jgi:hypothetical protein